MYYFDFSLLVYEFPTIGDWGDTGNVWIKQVKASTIYQQAFAEGEQKER